MKISDRVSRMEMSPLYELFTNVKELKAKGEDIVELGVGEPFQAPSEDIALALCDGQQNGHTKYVPATGSLDLRQEIAATFPDTVTFEYVFVFAGAKPGASAVMMSILDSGDEVFIQAPYYPPYVELARMCDANITLVDTEPSGFQMTADAVSAEIQKKGIIPKAVVVVTPGNPTSVVTPERELIDLLHLAERHDFVLIVDVVYRHFSGPEYDIAALVGNPHAIIIDSFSKKYAMQGYRIGYALICDQRVRKAVSSLQNNVFGCASSLSERAALSALQVPGITRYDTQYSMVSDWLRSIQVSQPVSSNGLYAFVDFSSKIRSFNGGSLAFAHFLLTNAQVFVTPGVAFGDKYDMYMRISVCVSEQELETGLYRMKQAIDHYVW